MMKFVFTALLLCFIAMAQAQNAPGKISYQAVVRDVQGNELVDQSVSVNFTIHKSTVDRFQTAWQLLATWLVDDHLRVGLSFDNTTGSILNGNQSSAELFLGYTLQKRAAGCIRYF